MNDAPQEVRCECSRKPLLARAGIESGSPFLLIRHNKSGKPVVGVKFTGGKAEILCRECHRVWTIRLGQRMEISKP